MSAPAHLHIVDNGSERYQRSLNRLAQMASSTDPRLCSIRTTGYEIEVKAAELRDLNSALCEVVKHVLCDVYNSCAERPDYDPDDIINDVQEFFAETVLGPLYRAARDQSAPARDDFREHRLSAAQLGVGR